MMYAPFPFMAIIIILYIDLFIFIIRNSISYQRTRLLLWVITVFPVSEKLLTLKVRFWRKTFTLSLLFWGGSKTIVWDVAGISPPALKYGSVLSTSKKSSPSFFKSIKTM